MSKFSEYLKHASAMVQTWPPWKQRLLGWDAKIPCDEGAVNKGGQNPPNVSTWRPPQPSGSDPRRRISDLIDSRCGELNCLYGPYEEEELRYYKGVRDGLREAQAFLNQT
jgi:hypothetical protein